MKKSLLLVSSVLLGLTSFGQWEGFENWTNNSVQTLDDYQTPANEWGMLGGTATYPSTDAQSGTYSVRLETVMSSFGDTVFGYFISGDPDLGTPGQQVTLNGVDSIIGYYKYDIMAGDSAVLLVMTTMAGTPTGGGTYYVTGTQSTWKRFSYPVNAALADSMLFGAATGDPLNNFSGIAGTWIQFDDVQLKKGAQVQSVANGGFENWTPINWEDPTGWMTFNSWALGQPSLPANKTTDSYAGTYAIELTTMLTTNGDTLWGAATNGGFGNNGPVGGVPFTSSPTSVECYYKYAPVSGDQAGINIEFRQGGSVVGNYGVGINSTVSTYTLWSQAVTPMTPDTMLIMLWAGNNIGSQLKVDNIDFIFPVGITEGLTVEKIVSYPNPATDALTIRFNIENDKNVMINLIDITGKTLVTRNMGHLASGTYRETFNTSEFASGMYFIEFTMGEDQITERFVIK
ncbi:MAG: T9SS type A sorting domain-containing protein [Flavobacteriales bacterium]|nr:T9SS type A sorting domain-containing protein [Flavobacteriales bacterium]